MVAKRIETELRAVGSPKRAEGEKRYLKSDIEHLGTGMPALRAIVKSTLKESPVKDPVLLARQLWRKPVFELRVAAIAVLRSNIDALTPEDMDTLESMLRGSKTWALVDDLATNVLGPLVVAHPTLGRTLDAWAEDDDFWIRRSAVLALLGELKRGEGDTKRFFAHADAMLEEKEFFIRKAIGWILREMSKKRPELVAEWILPRAHRASGVTIREVVRYLPEDVVQEIKDAR